MARIHGVSSDSFPPLVVTAQYSAVVSWKNHNKLIGVKLYVAHVQYYLEKLFY